MATKTLAQTGPWSAGATWGGSLPVDGDDIVIPAGMTLTFDMDLSAWVTGIGNMTITGAANGSTPGKFTVSETPGTYILKLGSGKAISGTTNVYNQGQFHIGTSKEVPYPYTCEFQLLSAGGTTTMINYDWLDMQVFCYQSSNMEDWHAYLTANAASGQPTISIDRDMTAKPYWRVGDPVVIASRNSASIYKEYGVIQSINANSITLTTNLGYTHYATGVVAGIRRNVRFIANTTSNIYTISGGAYNNLTTHKKCYAEHSNVQLTGGHYGMRVSQGNMEVGGVQAKFYYNGMPNYANVVDMILTGTIGAGVCSTFTNCLLVGSISNSGGGCPDAEYRGCKCLVHGTFINQSGGNNRCYDSLFENCVQVAWAPTRAEFYDCTMRLNFRTFERQPEVSGYRNYIADNTVANYQYYALHAASRIQMYDMRDSNGTVLRGQIRGYSSGGTTISHTAVPANPPIAMTFAHRSYFWEIVANAGGYPTYTNVDHSFDFPIGREPGQQISIKIYIKCNELPSLMNNPLKFQIVDLNAGFDGTGEVLAEVSPADNTAWQTLTLTYTVADHKRPAFRMRGRMFRDSSNPWYCDWFHIVEPLQGGGSRPRFRSLGV